MTGYRVLNRLVALPNFKDIEGADQEEVLQGSSSQSIDGDICCSLLWLLCLFA